jgi:hypothetical protein
MTVWQMNKEGEIKQLNEQEVAALPEYVRDTVGLNMLAVCDGIMYGTSPEHLKGEPT